MTIADLAAELTSLPTIADTATTLEAIVGDVIALAPSQTFASPVVTLTRRPGASSAAIAANSLTVDVAGYYTVTISAGGFTRTLTFVAFPASTLSLRAAPTAPNSRPVTRLHLRALVADARCTPARITASLEATPSTLVGLTGGTTAPAWAEFGNY